MKRKFDKKVTFAMKNLELKNSRLEYEKPLEPEGRRHSTNPYMLFDQ